MMRLYCERHQAGAPGKQKLTCESIVRNSKVVYDRNGITRPEWTTLPKNYTQTGGAAWDAVTPARGGGRRGTTKQ